MCDFDRFRFTVKKHGMLPRDGPLANTHDLHDVRVADGTGEQLGGPGRSVLFVPMVSFEDRGLRTDRTVATSRWPRRPAAASSRHRCEKLGACRNEVWWSSASCRAGARPTRRAGNRGKPRVQELRNDARRGRGRGEFPSGVPGFRGQKGLQRPSGDVAPRTDHRADPVTTRSQDRVDQRSHAASADHQYFQRILWLLRQNGSLHRHRSSIRGISKKSPPITGGLEDHPSGSLSGCHRARSALSPRCCGLFLDFFTAVTLRVMVPISSRDAAVRQDNN